MAAPLLSFVPRVTLGLVLAVLAVVTVFAKPPPLKVAAGRAFDLTIAGILVVLALVLISAVTKGEFELASVVITCVWIAVVAVAALLCAGGRAGRLWQPVLLRPIFGQGRELQASARRW